MTNPAGDKGAKAEREVAALLCDLLGSTVIKRKLGAGRREDTGDIYGVPECTIQVAAYTDLQRAIREKLAAVEEQRLNARTTFSALFVRRRGGRYVVVMTPEMWATYWREAQPVQLELVLDDIDPKGYL